MTVENQNIFKRPAMHCLTLLPTCLEKYMLIGKGIHPWLTMGEKGNLKTVILLQLLIRACEDNLSPDLSLWGLWWRRRPTGGSPSSGCSSEWRCLSRQSSPHSGRPRTRSAVSPHWHIRLWGCRSNWWRSWCGSLTCYYSPHHSYWRCWFSLRSCSWRCWGLPCNARIS